MDLKRRQPIGVELVKRGIVTENDIEKALEYQREHPKKKLGDILYILSKTSLNPTFSIEYIIKNQDRIKNKLLTNAIFDANKKANEIAKNLNIEINEIVNVDYSFSDQNFSLPLMENQCLKAVSTKENYNFDLNPDDIEVEENITIIFSIK